MKLDDFLKPKKVRCIIGSSSHGCLTAGKLYEVIGATYGRLKIHNDNGGNSWYDFEKFELVTESAENPLQNIELTPEFEAVEPTFKVGDKVYFGISPKIQTIESVHAYNNIKFIGTWGCAYARQCCHATTENYERLQATFTDIEFEEPPKPLTGSDLCFKKLRAGKEFIVCAVSDLSDEKAIKRLQDGDNCIRIIKDCDPAPYHFVDVHGIRHGFAVPLNDETGEPLTEAVLDE